MSYFASQADAKFVEEQEIGVLMDEAIEEILEAELEEAEAEEREPREIFITDDIEPFDPQSGQGWTRGNKWTRPTPDLKESAEVALAVPPGVVFRHDRSATPPGEEEGDWEDEEDSGAGVPRLTSQTQPPLQFRPPTRLTPQETVKIPTDVDESLAGDPNRIIDRFDMIMKQKGVPWKERMHSAINFMLKVFTANKLTCAVRSKTVDFCREVQEIQTLLRVRMTTSAQALGSEAEMIPIADRRNDFETRMYGCRMKLLTMLTYEAGARKERKEHNEHVQTMVRISAEQGIAFDSRRIMFPDFESSLKKGASWRD